MNELLGSIHLNGCTLGIHSQTETFRTDLYNNYNKLHDIKTVTKKKTEPYYFDVPGLMFGSEGVIVDTKLLWDFSNRLSTQFEGEPKNPI